MSTKKPKTFIFKAWFISNLRGISRKYPAIYETLNDSKKTEFIPGKTVDKVKRVSYRCKTCSKYFKRGDVQVDHVIPVVNPLSGMKLRPNGQPDWNDYIDRLFVGKEGLQVLCSECHDKKTEFENYVRKQSK